MPRLLSYVTPRLASVEWLNGPNARNSGSNTSVDGTEQTFSAYGDVVALKLTFTIAQGQQARRDRGLVTALQGGNAFRFTYVDADRMCPEEAGIVGPYGSQPWSNGKPWSNGIEWQPSYPVVPVAASAGFDTGVVRLADQFWGHALGIGDHLGFFPFHFGVYTVTEALGDGRYRIWPRLRKAVTSNDYATLFPTIVLRPGMNAATWRRNPSVAEGVELSCVEVPDYYVRDYYEG